MRQVTDVNYSKQQKRNEIIEKLKQSEEEIERGEVIKAEIAFQELRRKYSKKLQKSKYDKYIEEELEEADKEADDPNTKYYTHEEMKQMARRIVDGEC